MAAGGGKSREELPHPVFHILRHPLPAASAMARQMRTRSITVTNVGNAKTTVPGYGGLTSQNVFILVSFAGGVVNLLSEVTC